MAAYYNEFDPKAAAWLRELIKQGHIADGVVDDRSIEDVTPTELTGFTQCHFFAGIGVWSYALRRAGWADDRPVWTGSCPCQPFSAAGKGAGFDDERHLWPAFHHLISQCRPPIVLGEQVASKDGLGWLDLVQADLEATGYASGAVDLCAAGIGAPHIRQRLWWVGTRLADTDLASEGMVGNGGVSLDKGGSRDAWVRLGGSDSNERLANSDNAGSQGRVSGRSDQGREDQFRHGGRGSAIGGMADTRRELQAPDWGQSSEGGQQLGTQIRDNRRSRFGGLADTDGNGCDESLQQVQGGFPKRFGGNDIIGGMDNSNRAGQQAERPSTIWNGSQPEAVIRGAEVGMGDAPSTGLEGSARSGLEGYSGGPSNAGSDDSRLADTSIIRRGEGVADNGGLRGGDRTEGQAGRSAVNSDVGSGLADTKRTGFRDCGCGVNEEEARGEQGEEWQRERIWSVSGANGSDGGSTRPSPTNGFWRDADWLFCRDGKWRPVEPGTSPLAHGAAQRVGRLRGYGNAIVAQAAQAFIESVMD